jgi:protein associated with RNAse G/E
MWSEGDVVVLRDVWHGRVWRAVPGTVVRDDERETVVWIPRGTENVYPVDEDGREVRIARPDTTWATRIARTDVLVSFRAGEPWSIWHFFAPDPQMAHWYVNFEEVLGRHGRALDYRDHKLDLLAYPDGTTRLKDEDELEAAAALGLLDAAAIRRDAERVLRERPWPTGWEEFRPDPDWPIPSLPADWAAPPPSRGA